MYADDLILADESATHQHFDLVSRTGMESVRRHTTAETGDNYILEIKNTIDADPLKPNRHLVKVSKDFTDAVTGEKYPVSVHMVITRAKGALDADVIDMCFQLVSFNGTNGFDDALKGES